jgi:hypothetical protein
VLHGNNRIVTTRVTRLDPHVLFSPWLIRTRGCASQCCHLHSIQWSNVPICFITIRLSMCVHGLRVHMEKSPGSWVACQEPWETTGILELRTTWWNIQQREEIAAKGQSNNTTGGEKMEVGDSGGYHAMEWVQGTKYVRMRKLHAYSLRPRLVTTFRYHYFFYYFNLHLYITWCSWQASESCLRPCSKRQFQWWNMDNSWRCNKMEISI